MSGWDRWVVLPLSPGPGLISGPQVAVFRVDDVQGKEFRALLLSTVRTCFARDDEDLEEDAGFLTNPKVWIDGSSFSTFTPLSPSLLLPLPPPICISPSPSSSLSLSASSSTQQ